MYQRIAVLFKAARVHLRCCRNPLGANSHPTVPTYQPVPPLRAILLLMHRDNGRTSGSESRASLPCKYLHYLQLSGPAALDAAGFSSVAGG